MYAITADAVDILPTPENPRHSEADTLLCKDGRVLLAWSRFRGPQDDATADIYAAWSADGGRTWGEPYLLVPAEEATQNVMSVSFWRERQTGDALLFYLRKNGPEDLHVWVRRSADECRTWSPALRVTQDPGYHVMNNARVMQTHEGRLIAPVARRTGGASHEVTCHYSDDGGGAWTAGATLRLEEGAVQEPGVVERTDGSLLLYARTNLGYVYAATSHDGAETWSALAPIRDLPAPLAPATMARLPDGALVCAYNHRLDGRTATWADRTPLALARSEDGGATWRRLQDLEPDEAYCYGYTSLRLYGYQAIVTYYVWPRTSPRNFFNTALRVRVVPASRFGGASS